MSQSMPHKSKVNEHNVRVVQRFLPQHYNQKECLKEVNAVLVSTGGRSLSQSSFSRIWKQQFPDVSVVRDMPFSKCNQCIELKELLASTVIEKERMAIRQQMSDHQIEQKTCRQVYWQWRAFSQLQPDKYLCLIHDKMDQHKTFLPRLDSNPKSCQNAFQLKVSLAGMLTHGHGAGTYGHFALDLWEDGPNFHVGSIFKCLRTIERGSIECRRYTPSSKLFEVLMDDNPLTTKQRVIESNHKVMVGEPRRTWDSFPIEGTKLPEELNVQLDNCWKENKNRWMFLAFSYLTAVGVFKVVKVGFMMVGHTHDDIDAFFGNFSSKLRRETVTSLPELMEIFENTIHPSPMGFLFDEVPDWKSFVDGYMLDGKDALQGHSKPLQFKFWVRNGIPVMQYKFRPSDRLWMPVQGIELWKRGLDGMPLIPEGEPKPVPPSACMKDSVNISKGLNSYITHWESMLASPHVTCDKKAHLESIIKYWTNVIQQIEVPQECASKLRDGFLPQSRYQGHQVTNRGASKDHLAKWFVGNKSEKPKWYDLPEWDSYEDIQKGFFVLVRPDGAEYPVWLGVALTGVTSEKEDGEEVRPGFDIQYWAPVGRFKQGDVTQQYANCWNKRWKENPADPPRRELVDCVLWSYPPCAIAKDKSHKIPMKDRDKAESNLAAISAYESDMNTT